MNNILTIIKKEFMRFFKDKRMIITIILPGLIIYLMYSVMGTVIENIAGETVIPVSYTAYCSIPLEETGNEKVDKLYKELNAVLVLQDVSEDEAKQLIKEGTIDLAIIFPEDFAKTAFNTAEGAEIPNISVYYNSTSDSSAYGYRYVNAILENNKNSAYSVNGGLGAVFNLADEKKMSGQIFASMLPMLMFALIASGCVAVAPESIAGEKERGTMATMLITPIQRWQLALGKIISLSCFALLSGISSFIGVILSIPKLLGGMLDVTLSYGVGDYFMILGLVLSVVLVIISAFSVVSGFAKTVKEAGTLISPLMIVIIVLGAIAMAISSPAVGLYAIPVLGSALAMASILSFTVTPLAFALGFVSNIVVTVILVIVLSFMFKSEKIMFNK